MRGPILKLLSATGYASVVGYAGMLVLVRLYPEASFGLFDFVISIVGILTPFVSLRYEDTLMLAENDRDSAHSFLLAFGVTIGLSLGLFLLLPFGDLFAGFFWRRSHFRLALDHPADSDCGSVRTDLRALAEST